MMVSDEFDDDGGEFQGEDDDDPRLDDEFLAEVGVFAEAVVGGFVEVLENLDLVVQGDVAVGQFGVPEEQFGVNFADVAGEVRRDFGEEEVEPREPHAAQGAEPDHPVRVGPALEVGGGRPGE